MAAPELVSGQHHRASSSDGVEDTADRRIVNDFIELISRASTDETRRIALQHIITLQQTMSLIDQLYCVHSRLSFKPRIGQSLSEFQFTLQTQLTNAVSYYVGTRGRKKVSNPLGPNSASDVIGKVTKSAIYALWNVARLPTETTIGSLFDIHKYLTDDKTGAAIPGSKAVFGALASMTREIIWNTESGAPETGPLLTSIKKVGAAPTSSLMYDTRRMWAFLKLREILKDSPLNHKVTELEIPMYELRADTPSQVGIYPLVTSPIRVRPMAGCKELAMTDSSVCTLLKVQPKVGYISTCSEQTGIYDIILPALDMAANEEECRNCVAPMVHYVGQAVKSPRARMCTDGGNHLHNMNAAIVSAGSGTTTPPTEAKLVDLMLALTYVTLYKKNQRALGPDVLGGHVYVVTILNCNPMPVDLDNAETTFIWRGKTHHPSKGLNDKVSSSTAASAADLAETSAAADKK